MSMLFALAMNKNLSAKQFDSLVKQHIDNSKKIHDKFFTQLDSLETDDQKSMFINAAMPVLCMFSF